MEEEIWEQTYKDDKCSDFSFRTEYSVRPFCKDCKFVIKRGESEVNYYCGYKDDPKCYLCLKVEFYDFCGEYIDKDTGENFERKVEFLTDIYIKRCKYILNNKNRYIKHCKKNNINLHSFHECYYWLGEHHTTNSGDCDYQKFELSEKLYNMIKESYKI